MSYASIAALLAITSCIAAKWVLAWRVLRMKRTADVDRSDYRDARKQLGHFVAQRKLRSQEEKRLKARIASQRRNLASWKKVVQELVVQEEKEREVYEKQKKLLRGAGKS